MYDAERIASDAPLFTAVGELLESLQRFHDRMARARSGLRLVNGGRS